MSRKTITIVTVGTRGDVQPYIALGLGLERAGYQVRIAAPALLKALVERYGLSAFPIHSIDPKAFLGQGGVQDATRQRTPLGQLIALLREAHPLIKDFVEEVWQACQDSDVIIASTIFYGAQDSAEKLEIPCVHTFLHPILPTATIASPLFPQLTTGIGVPSTARHTRSSIRYSGSPSVRLLMLFGSGSDCRRSQCGGLTVYLPALILSYFTASVPQYFQSLETGPLMLM